MMTCSQVTSLRRRMILGSTGVAKREKRSCAMVTTSPAIASCASGATLRKGTVSSLPLGLYEDNERKREKEKERERKRKRKKKKKKELINSFQEEWGGDILTI